MYGHEISETPPRHAGRYKARSPVAVGSGRWRTIDSYAGDVRDGGLIESDSAASDDSGHYLPADDQTNAHSGDGSYDYIGD